MVNTCVICHAIIWPDDAGLCLEHQRFALLWSLVSVGAMSDWPPNTGGCVSHKEMQTIRLPDEAQPRSWWIVVGDINRMARMWLDGWHGDGERGVAA